MPSRERRSGGARVTSSPRKRTRPEVVLSSPERRLRKVDLPAPFGPMMAWTAPASMRKEIPATAASAPKRRVSASVSSNASTTGSPQQAREPAGKREDGGDGDGADERVPVRGPLLSEVLEHGEEDQPGLPPAEDGRIDESVQGRVEDAGEAGEGSGGDEGGDLVAARTIAERAHASFVDADSGQHAPEGSPHRAREQVIDRHQRGPDEEVRGPAVAEIEERRAEGREAGALRDVESIRSAEAGRFAEEEVEHLCEGERDHDQVHAARAHAEEPDHERGHGRPRERERERREGAHQPGTVGEAGEEIGAEPEAGGVP